MALGLPLLECQVSPVGMKAERDAGTRPSLTCQTHRTGDLAGETNPLVSHPLWSVTPHFSNLTPAVLTLTSTGELVSRRCAHSRLIPGVSIDGNSRDVSGGQYSASKP
jgi:hypothetical protein